MDRIVNLLAPQNHFQTFCLFVFSQVLIGLVGFIYDVGVHGIPREAFLANATGTFIVAAPFILLVLLVLRHQKVLQDRLAELADTDALTGVLNRRAFHNRVTREGYMVSSGALMLMDVDRFKEINDAYGHDAGDRCLKALAGNVVRLTDGLGQIARLGGDEFVVFLAEPDPQKAHRIGSEIAMGYHIPCERSRCQITLSVGVVMVPSGVALASCLRAADAEMFSAKARGRAQVSLSVLRDLSSVSEQQMPMATLG